MSCSERKRRPQSERLGHLFSLILIPALLLAAPGRALGQESDDGWDDHPSASEPAPAPTFGGTEEGADVAPGPEEEEPPRRGISARWFWVSLALGVGLGVGAGVTGGYALSLNQLYLEERTDPLLRERGMTLQLATNVMIGVASAMALVALLTGIFTDWSPRPRSEDEEDHFARASALGATASALRDPLGP